MSAVEDKRGCQDKRKNPALTMENGVPELSEVKL